MVTLAITQRDTKEKPKALRATGTLPAVLYGPQEEATPIAIDAKAFEKLWHAAGESTVITLQGVGENKEALIQDVALNPVTNKPQHADLYIFEKGKKLTVSVPLAFVGEAPGVKSKGGTLVKVMHEMEIEAQPKDLPHEITVDISTLDDIDSILAVKDVSLPEGVVALGEPEAVIVSIAAPKEEEEEAPKEIDMESIEVEQKGKGDEGGEEGSDAESTPPEQKEE